MHDGKGRKVGGSRPLFSLSIVASAFSFSPLPSLHTTQRIPLGKVVILSDWLRHFRVPLDLCIKTRLSAQLLIWKWFFIAMQVILIFTNVHLTSFESDVFWNSAGGGLFTWLLRRLLQTQTTWLKTRQVRSCHSGVGAGAGDYPAYYENDHQLLIWETKGTS